MNEINPKALFRLSVLGPLASRERLERGELQQIIRELAGREYAIPGTRRRHLGEKMSPIAVMAPNRDRRKGAT